MISQGASQPTILSTVLADENSGSDQTEQEGSQDGDAAAPIGVVPPSGQVAFEAVLTPHALP